MSGVVRGRSSFWRLEDGVPPDGVSYRFDMILDIVQGEYEGPTLIYPADGRFESLETTNRYES